MYRVIWIAAVLILTMTAGKLSHGEEIWKITSLNWPPYSGAEMPNQGNSVEKLRERLKKEGICLVVEFYPWKRAQKLAENKAYVGYFPAWPEEVREGFVASPPVDWSKVSVLTLAGSVVVFEGIDALFREYHVGTVYSYVYPEQIEDAMRKYPDHVDKAPNELTLLKKLSRGRHPVAITDHNVMIYLAKKEGLENVVRLDKIIEEKALVLALRDDEENRRRITLLTELFKGSGQEDETGKVKLLPVR